MSFLTKVASALNLWTIFVQEILSERKKDQEAQELIQEIGLKQYIKSFEQSERGNNDFNRLHKLEVSGINKNWDTSNKESILVLSADVSTKDA